MTSPDARLMAEMLKESMQQGHTPSLTVTSNSMRPLLRPGDQVFVAPVELSGLRPGEIITLVDEADVSQLLTHRYWGCDQQADECKVVTRGDRPLLFDHPHAPANIVGRVVRCRRNGRILALNAGPGQWLNRRLASAAAAELRWITGFSADQSAHPLDGVAQSNRLAQQRAKKQPVRLLRRSVLLLSTGLTELVSLIARLRN